MELATRAFYIVLNYAAKRTVHLSLVAFVIDEGVLRIIRHYVNCTLIAPWGLGVVAFKALALVARNSCSGTLCLCATRAGLLIIFFC